MGSWPICYLEIYVQVVRSTLLNKGNKNSFGPNIKLSQNSSIIMP